MQPKKKSAPRSKPKPRLPRGLYHKELSEAQDLWLEFFNGFSMYVPGLEPLARQIPGRELTDEIVNAAAYFADRALDAFETRWGEVKLPEED